MSNGLTIELQNIFTLFGEGLENRIVLAKCHENWLKIDREIVEKPALQVNVISYCDRYPDNQICHIGRCIFTINKNNNLLALLIKCENFSEHFQLQNE